MNRKAILAAIVSATLSAPALAQPAGPNAFEIMAIGDMPYKLPDDYAKFDRLIAAINTAKPAFTIHVGDIKSGSSPCTDENLKKVFDQFQTFDGALVYTPGDNEWTDCHRERAGRFDPLERLAKVREMFFPVVSKSLGRSPIDVQSQAVVMGNSFAKYVENTRFTRNGVMFIQLHVVGSNNNFEAGEARVAMEFFERDAANVAWLDASMKLAAEQNLKAVVISMQANLYDIRQSEPSIPRASGFVRTIQGIERGQRTFRKPMLVIHGDDHRLIFDQFRDTNLKIVPQVLRLQVMGEEYVHGVTVTIDPDSPGVFGIKPFIVPENGQH